jgi:hypothetical protein
VTHWSSRLLASHLGDVSHATVARLWQAWQLQPWRAETFKISTDPQLSAKITGHRGGARHSTRSSRTPGGSGASSITPTFESCRRCGAGGPRERRLWGSGVGIIRTGRDARSSSMERIEHVAGVGGPVLGSVGVISEGVR